jgi:plastocyanin
VEGATKRILAVGTSLVLLGSAGGAVAATAKVRAKGEKWRPVHTYIGRNDVVRWTNPTSKVHDLKAYGGGWKLTAILDPGDSVKRKFKKRGTYKYRCVRHSGVVGGKCQGMCGLIHVT